MEWNARKLYILENNINYILRSNIIVEVIELRWFFDMVSES
jgi:hypothetical protein